MNSMQQQMPNLDDISDPITAINMALVLMAKAFKLNYSTPTNNNQRSLSNPRNNQISHPGKNIGQDRQMQMVGGNGNQNGLIVISRIANQNASQNGNGNVVAARAEGNGNGNNRNQTQLLIAQKEKATIQLQAEEFGLMAAAWDIDEIEEVNANCILMANLQQASTSGTQTDKALVYDSDGSAEVHHYDSCYNNDIFNIFTQEEQYTELLDPFTKPYTIQQNNNNVISVESSVEHNRGTVEQHLATIEKTRAYFESFYNNLAIEVEKVNTVTRKMKETNADLTTKLARYKAYQEFHKIIKDEIASIVNQVDARVQNFENHFVKEAAKFVRDFKSLAKEADESLDKFMILENENKHLLRATISQDIMCNVLLLLKHPISKLRLNIRKKGLKNISLKRKINMLNFGMIGKKCKECKYNKTAYDKAYNDMQNQIKRLQAQLGDLKGKSMDTQCASDTLDPSSQKLEDENVSLEFQVIPKVVETIALSKPVTSNSGPSTKESKVMKNNKVIALGMFRINSLKTSRVENFVPNKPVKSSVRTKPITTSQPHVTTKKDVNSDLHGFSFTRINNTMVTSASKSSCIKNKEVEVEEHHRNLLLSRNQKHMSSECDDACTSNPQEPTSKWFQNSTSFLGRALFYPKNDYEHIGKLGAKCDIGLFIGYSANSCAYRVYNRRTRKIMETMNVTFDELSAMDFEQCTMYDDYIGGQPLAAQRTTPAALAPQDLQTLTASTTTAYTAPTPTNSSSQAADIPNTLQDVYELQQNDQQQDNQA
uniref:Retroviral polymerase SH3-like domain-containing protein n=1 Tax=Tanacetum cinerariifolium TaxID=118510 RepID=A0A6L2NA72_TANCI|nr:hypothetical protein [Tanacetum cinerariifolium]